MGIANGSDLWNYLSSRQQQLSRDGDILISDLDNHPDLEMSDYSYLVFPFAKLYEGFLKRLFLDLEFIEESEYRSDHYRIGKALSPNIARKLGPNSAYLQVEMQFGKDLATRLWHTWKEGRNLVFHYFPHNFRSLTRDQALVLIGNVIGTMDQAVADTNALTIRKKQDDTGE